MVVALIVMENFLILYGKNVAGPIKSTTAGTKKPRETDTLLLVPGSQAQDGKFDSK